MAAFLSHLPTLLGVIVGALGSYVVVSLTDRTRLRRELAARSADQRLRTYAEYARTLSDLAALTTRVAAARGLAEHPAPLSPTAAGPRLEAAHAERAVLWEALLLVGSRPVVESAREWHQSLAQLERLVREDEPSADSWSARATEQRSARTRFHGAARRDLGGASPAA